MTQPVITVASAFLEDNLGRILLGQRPANKPMPFLWEFPGGKIEVGEPPEQALVRELEEEIGIIVSPLHLKPLTFVSMAYSHFHIVLLGYHCLEWTGTPVARESQGGLEWVMPADLKKYPMPEANHFLIDFFKEQGQAKIKAKYA
jgi:8-oxo-dGTP diphosphatase